MGSQSTKLFAEACQYIPGGVNSPVRSFSAVGGSPLFVSKAKGSRLWDADGREYIDFVGSWGASILGHAHDEVLSAVSEVMERGFSFGAPTHQETLLAEKISTALPSVDQVRMVSSGTEACFSAIRLARGFTMRDKIIKFDGHYHGHSDSLLVEAGSGVATLGVPSCIGIPQSVAEDTISLPFNDKAIVEHTFSQYSGQIAAVILEPIAGNSGFILPEPGYLAEIKRICTENQALLICDEVMTGFRVAWGGAQVFYDLEPDITTLGKVIGGGMPLAAFGGRQEIMAKLAPSGPVYQAGTLSGNPVAVACGLKTLEILSRPDTYAQLTQTTHHLTAGLKKIAEDCGIELTSHSQGGMFGCFFRGERVTSFAQALESDRDAFHQFFWGMLKRGIYWAPSAFEAGFVSTAHTQQDIDLTLEVAAEVFKEMMS